MMVKRKKELWEGVCSLGNLYKAYYNARKGKTKKQYVKTFEAQLEENIGSLRTELLLHAYIPEPHKTFIIRDPKTRKISKSEFRDRIIHHAVCNIIEPIFEKVFIYDSFANRKGKGTLKALERFDQFKRKTSKNNTNPCYIFKADIRHYFDEVDHAVLIEILKKRIDDDCVIWLVTQILKNYTKTKGKGMPLGNLTSQFFANVYLNELDQYIKNTLRVEKYIRYVDDFVIFDSNKNDLVRYKEQIDIFLKKRLLLQLHQGKSRIRELRNGVDFLGFRTYAFHRLLRKSNMRKIKRKMKQYPDRVRIEGFDATYESFQGWTAYATQGNTYKLRKKLMNEFESRFPHDISTIEVNRLLKTIKTQRLIEKYTENGSKTIKREEII